MLEPHNAPHILAAMLGAAMRDMGVEGVTLPPEGESEGVNDSLGEDFISPSDDHIEASTTYLAVAFIAIIISTGTIGNLMVLLAVLTTKGLRTVGNLLVVNLAVCDLLLVGAVLPFNVVTYLVQDWTLAPALCSFVGFLNYTLTGTILITITLIAWNRHTLVVDQGSYRRHFTWRRLALYLPCAWVGPALLLLPAALGVWGSFGYVPMMVACNLQLDHHSQSFKLFLLLGRFGVPCVLILVFYSRIFLATRASRRRLLMRNNSISARDRQAQRREMRLTWTMLAIFLVFAASYLPCTVTGLIDWKVILSRRFHMFCAITVYIGSALNPLIYGLMNSKFREAYYRVLCCMQGRCGGGQDDAARALVGRQTQRGSGHRRQGRAFQQRRASKCTLRTDSSKSCTSSQSKGSTNSLSKSFTSSLSKGSTNSLGTLKSFTTSSESP